MIDRAEKGSPHIDPALWANFANAGSQDEYCRHWLTLQCAFISNVIQGILVLKHPETESFTPVAKWPEEGEDPERLSEISERVLKEQCGLLVELEESNGNLSYRPPRYGVAYPVLIEDSMHGIIALEVSAESEAQLKSFMENLQWGSSWIELLLQRRRFNAFL